MKKRIPPAVWAVALFCAALALAGWFLVRAHEPFYKGRSLTAWLDDGLIDGMGCLPKESDEAVRHIGTNALPTLLRMAVAQDSPLKNQMFYLFPFNRYSPKPFGLRRAWALHRMAQWGFHALGPAAQPALPDLRALLYNTNREIQMSAIGCLAVIWSASRLAITNLMTLATNYDLNVRASAKMALGEIHSEPEIVVPFLVESLKANPQDLSSRAAMGALGSFGADAREAIPVLISFLTNSNGFSPTQYALNRSEALYALRRIDPEVGAKWEAITMPNFRRPTNFLSARSMRMEKPK